MIDKPLEREMARCNRNLLAVNLFILAFCAFCAFVSQKYWYNFAFGPFPTDAESLFATDNPATLSKQFVVLKGEKTLNTNKTQIYQTYDRHTNEVKSEEVTGYYLFLRSGDKAVVVRSPVLTQATSFEGKLESLPDDIYQALAQPLAPDVRKRISPLMLDVVGYRQSGFIAIFFGIPLLGLSFWNLRKWLMRRSDANEHPIMKTLAKYGDQRELAPKLNEELRSPDRKELGGTIILRNWLVGRFPFTLQIIDMQNIVWIYKLQTRHSVNFIPTGTTVELIINTRDGKTQKFSGTEKQVDAAVVEIFARVPWIYGGYSDELKKSWSKNSREMINAVDEAKKQKQAKPDSAPEKTA